MYLLGTGFLPGGSGVEGFAGPVQRKIQVMKHQVLNSVRINLPHSSWDPYPAVWQKYSLLISEQITGMIYTASKRAEIRGSVKVLHAS